MKKIFVGLVVCFLFASLMALPFASATTACINANSGTPGANSNWRLQDVHPSGDSDKSAIGESFKPNATMYVSSVVVYLEKFAGVTGFLQASITSVQGTYGTSNVPLAVLENSDLVDSSTVQGSFLPITFTFSGSVELTSGTEYGFYVSAYNETFTTSYCINVGLESVPDAAGNAFRYYNDAWAASSTIDLVYEVYGSDVEGTPTPTPTAAPSSTSTGDEDIENLTAIILPWLVPLLVCLIPALLGYKFVGELGFFIGLNVGVILAYVTLAATAYAFPLWGIILVGVMDVAVVLMRR